MTRNNYRIMSLCATFFIFIYSIVGTFAWQSISQQVINEVYSPEGQIAVCLIKKEKLEDGTIIETSRLAGAKFLLFTDNGQVLGETYVTDEKGEIKVSLPKGEYYFQEIEPPIGYCFDEENGKEIIRYPFQVEKERGELIVEAYNRKKNGGFCVKKIVENKDGVALSKEQQEKEFSFVATIYNDRTNPSSLYEGEIEYNIDQGIVQKYKNGTVFSLKHGQTAYFSGLPLGISYEVKEIPSENYTVQSTGHMGVINKLSSSAIFVNRYEEKIEKESVLYITKRIVGDVPNEERNREFLFELTLDGKQHQFTLKNGETKEFPVRAGQTYEVKEERLTGYTSLVENGYGTISQGGEVVEVVATNIYEKEFPILSTIRGEKTWNLTANSSIQLPKSIEVQLKQGTTIVASKIVRPDKEGKWKYEFEVPKYDNEGKLILYHIEEVALNSFYPTYQGYDIVNAPYEPIFIDPPIIRKEVKGLSKEEAKKYKFIFEVQGMDQAPMPEGAEGQIKRFVQVGDGATEIGKICYNKTGIYRYEVSEIDTKEEGFIYDRSSYTLYVYVTEQNGKLQASHRLVKNEQQVEDIVFVNIYESSNETPYETLNKQPDDVLRIPVVKYWKHGANLKEKYPNFIVVYLYADGELYMQRMVTEEDGWTTEFVVPKYSRDMKEIVYTIDEAEVLNYSKDIKGNVITNTYVEDKKNPNLFLEFGMKNPNDTISMDFNSAGNSTKDTISLDENNRAKHSETKKEVKTKDAFGLLTHILLFVGSTLVIIYIRRKKNELL